MQSLKVSYRSPLLEQEFEIEPQEAVRLIPTGSNRCFLFFTSPHFVETDKSDELAFRYEIQRLVHSKVLTQTQAEQIFKIGRSTMYRDKKVLEEANSVLSLSQKKRYPKLTIFNGSSGKLSNRLNSWQKLLIQMAKGIRINRFGGVWVLLPFFIKSRMGEYLREVKSKTIKASLSAFGIGLIYFMLSQGEITRISDLRFICHSEVAPLIGRDKAYASSYILSFAKNIQTEDSVELSQKLAKRFKEFGLFKRHTINCQVRIRSFSN